MHAVNSTVGPKIENDYLAEQIGQLYRFPCVDPLETIRELRGSHFSGVGGCGGLRCGHDECSNAVDGWTDIAQLSHVPCLCFA